MNKKQTESGYPQLDKSNVAHRKIEQLAEHILKSEKKLADEDAKIILSYFFSENSAKRVRLWTICAKRKIISPFSASREQLQEIVKELKDEA